MAMWKDRCGVLSRGVVIGGRSKAVLALVKEGIKLRVEADFAACPGGVRQTVGSSSLHAGGSGNGSFCFT